MVSCLWCGKKEGKPCDNCNSEACEDCGSDKTVEVIEDSDEEVTEWRCKDCADPNHVWEP